MCVARHAQITQNNKLSYFFSNILRKKWVIKVDFLHADEHESFLQIDTMMFDGDGQASPKFPK